MKNHKLSQPIPEQQADSRAKLLQSILSAELEEEQVEELLLQAQEEVLEVLVFQLGTERYGLNIRHVAEIIRYREPTEVPHTVDFLDGIITLRGQMIPVINGRKRMGHEPRPPDKKSRIIVIHDGSELQGILVDSATQVVRLPQKSLEPTPSVVTGPAAAFIEGVCEHKNQMIILLNLERFLRFM